MTPLEGGSISNGFGRASRAMQASGDEHAKEAGQGMSIEKALHHRTPSYSSIFETRRISAILAGLMHQ
jgi:hypothetical protein